MRKPGRNEQTYYVVQSRHYGYIYLFITRKIANISSFGKLSLFEYIRFMTFDSYLVRVNRAGMKKYVD